MPVHRQLHGVLGGRGAEKLGDQVFVVGIAKFAPPQRKLVHRLDSFWFPRPRDQSQRPSRRPAILRQLLAVLADLRPVALDEILAPIHKGFEESGMSEDEWLELFENEREAMWQDKHGAK